MDEQLGKRLRGEQDSRGPKGIFSRGANVYNGASHAAHSGGGSQFGRPKKNPAQRETGSPSLSQTLVQQASGPVDMNPKPGPPSPEAIKRRLMRGPVG